MYIYGNHLGGFYTSEELLDYDALYCETCGDADILIGHADTAQEAFDLLSNEISDGCDVCDDFGKCKKDPIACGRYTGRYSLSYIMNFIAEEFPEDTQVHVYVVCRGKDGSILINCHPNGRKWGEHMLPSATCAFPKYADAVAKGLCCDMNDPDMSSLKKIAEKSVSGRKCCIYEVLETGTYEKDAAWNGNCGWYGYFTKEESHLIEEEKWLEKYIWKD